MTSLIIRPDVLKKSVGKGALACLVLLTVYFLVLTFVSGRDFAWQQFSQFWYFIISLALGFGVQFSLYNYLKAIAREQALTGKVLAASGTTSTAAMISCCAHYLTTIMPILGITGVITVISQYQVQFFWLGLFFNILGIIYIGNKVLKVSGITINKTTIIYSSLIAVILAVVFFNSVSINIGSTASTGAVSGSAQAGNNSLETKESNEGPVSVTVTPQDLEDSSPTWNFAVSLNTHSGSIDTDLVTVAELVDNQGKSLKPISWEGSAPGGHHRNGILKFNPISPKPKFIELKIKDIGGIPERSFKWNL